MSSGTTHEAQKARAMEMANRGIDAVAAGDYQSGLGDALLKGGYYQSAIKMAGAALAFCTSVRAPLAALSMVGSFLRLGDGTRARMYAQQACDLRGEGVLEAFCAADREALGLTASLR